MNGEHRRRFRQKLLIGFLLCLALADGRQLLTSPSAGQDFRDFYAAASLVARGQNPYDRAALAARQDELFNQPAGLRPGDARYYDVVPFPQGPWIAIGLVPLTLLPWQAAYAVYLALIISGIGLATLVYLRMFGWRRANMQLGLAASLLSPVVFINLFQGQTTWLLYLGLALAIWLASRMHAILAGLALTLVWVKPHLGIPLLLVVAASNRDSLLRLVGGFLAGSVVAFGLASLVMPNVLYDWPRTMLGQWSGPLQEADLASVDAFFAPAFSGWIRQLMVLLVLVGAIAAGIWLLRYAQGAAARALTVLLVLMAAAPYAHSYDTLLLIPVLLLLVGPDLEGWKHPLTELALWAFMTLPLAYFLGFRVGFFNGFAAIPVLLMSVAWFERHRMVAGQEKVQVAA